MHQSQLSDQSSHEYFLLQQEKSLEWNKNAQVLTKYHLIYRIKIRQKLIEFYRAEISKLDVIQKNITGLNKRTVYFHYQKLKQTGTSQKEW